MTLKTLLLGTALAFGGLSAGLAPPGVAAAQAGPRAIAFDIAPGPLPASLRALAAQSGEQVLFDAAAADRHRAPALRGRFTTEAGLARLLAGTGLAAERTAAGVWVIRGATSDRAEAAEPTALEEVVVTGTLLRGAEGPSPVVRLSRDDIDAQGHASVAQVLQALPQNFGGTANEGALLNGADLSGSNASFASGVNLRGLGSDATLVLVNGRRMSGSGSRGDFADISTLPTAAVERIDVLLDGASALYGSDAVGGVVNIILRRDFEGTETRARIGSTTDGPAGEFGFAQTFGRRWDGGGGLVSYEYLDREALPVSERPLAGDADLRRFGGTDRRQFFSHPGNIVVFDRTAGGYTPRYAIPDGQDGSDLEPGDFVAGTVNRENQRDGMNVLGRQTRHSVFGAVHQNLGARLAVSGDVRYGRRAWDTVGGGSTATLTVDTRNPHFVSPTGAAVHQIAYAFQDELGNPRLHGETENLGVSLGADLDLGGDWRLTGYAAWGGEWIDNRSDGQLNAAHLSEALGRTADNPATAFSAARDGYFNPFGAGGANGPAVLDFIGAGYTRNRYETSVASANLQVDGPLWRLPGGDLDLAFGVNLRRETHATGGESFLNAAVPAPFAPRDAAREVSAAFLEARVPLFGPENRRPGLERLELSVAARAERYDDIGSTANPKVGVAWSPVDGLTARASWGTSFRAPALVELNERASNSPSLLPRAGGQTLTMIRYGGNPELEPEEAESWTAGLEYRPPGARGTRLSVGWFRTIFDNRVGRPALENVLNALSDPALSPFVRLVSPATSEADRALIQAFLDDPDTDFADLFPADAYGAVLDARYLNTSRVKVEGIDLEASAALDRGEHRFGVSAGLSWLLDFSSQATPSAPTAVRLNTPGNPVDLRGRVSGSWTRGDWGARATFNYVDGYADLAGRPIDAWLTTDLQLRYEPASGPLAGLSAALTAQNLFDEDPPFHDALGGIGYDAANANVMGRFVSLQLTRRW